MAQGPWAPPADLEETEDAYIVEAEVPGVSREDVTVELTGRELRIHGETSERERTGVVRQQARRTGRFDYRMMLPGDADADQVSANLSRGVLRVRAPKTQQTKGRQIEITASDLVTVTGAGRGRCPRPGQEGGSDGLAFRYGCVRPAAVSPE